MEHYCPICERKKCRSPEEHNKLINKAKAIQKKSKIWNIFRGDRKYRLYNGGMSTDCLDTPYSYMCTLGKVYSGYYEIIHYSRTKKIEIYKCKYIGDIPNLHYYFYISPGIQRIFESELQEELSQEELCKLANRNWAKFSNFAKNPANAAFLKEMKRKMIKCLIYDEQIVWSDNKQKYVSYRYMEFCEENGYTW